VLASVVSGAAMHVENQYNDSHAEVQSLGQQVGFRHDARRI
jgi:hypothetical protein